MTMHRVNSAHRSWTYSWDTPPAIRTNTYVGLVLSKRASAMRKFHERQIPYMAEMDVAVDQWEQHDERRLLGTFRVWAAATPRASGGPLTLIESEWIYAAKHAANVLLEYVDNASMEQLKYANAAEHFFVSATWVSSGHMEEEVDNIAGKVHIAGHWG